MVISMRYLNYLKQLSRIASSLVSISTASGLPNITQLNVLFLG